MALWVPEKYKVTVKTRYPWSGKPTICLKYCDFLKYLYDTRKIGDRKGDKKCIKFVILSFSYVRFLICAFPAFLTSSRSRMHVIFLERHSHRISFHYRCTLIKTIFISNGCLYLSDILASEYSEMHSFEFQNLKDHNWFQKKLGTKLKSPVYVIIPSHSCHVNFTRKAYILKDNI